MMRLLTIITLLPLAGALLTLAASFMRAEKPRALALAFSGSAAATCLVLFLFYKPVAGAESSLWIREEALPLIPNWNVLYEPAADGISLVLALLASGLAFVTIFFRKGMRPMEAALLMGATGFALAAFFSTDMLLFLAFAESGLVLTILLAASSSPDAARTARIGLSLQVLTGIPMLLALLAIHWKAGGGSFLVADLLQPGMEIKGSAQYFLMGAFVFTLGARMPLVPFQSWTADLGRTSHPAIVPTLMVLTSDLAAYGLIRFVIPLFPQVSLSLAPVLGWIAAVGLIHMGMIAYIGGSPGKILAQSATGLSSLVIVGLVTATRPAISGAVFLMIGHGISLAVLFFILAALADRGNPSMVSVAQTMPRITAAVAVGILALIGIPGTAGFVAQILTLAGAFEKHPAITGVAVLGLAPLTVALVSILRHAQAMSNERLPDPPRGLAPRESIPLALLLIAVIFLGIRPGFVLSRINPSVDKLVMEIQHRRAIVQMIEKPIRSVESPFDEQRPARTKVLTAPGDLP